MGISTVTVKGQHLPHTHTNVHNSDKRKNIQIILHKYVYIYTSKSMITQVSVISKEMDIAMQGAIQGWNTKLLKKGSYHSN